MSTLSRSITVHGIEYVTTTMACDRLAPDVTPEILRDWVRRGLLDVARDQHGHPVRLPGRHGPENVYEWSRVSDAEHSTRTSGTGRARIPRQRAAEAAA